MSHTGHLLRHDRHFGRVQRDSDGQLAVGEHVHAVELRAMSTDDAQMPPTVTPILPLVSLSSFSMST